MSALSPPRLDPLVHQPVRLQVLALLYRNRHASCKAICEALQLTPGNLASHAAKLEAAGYVRSVRALKALSFEARLRITPEGDLAFREHVAALEALIREVRAAPTVEPLGHSGTDAEPAGF